MLHSLWQKFKASNYRTTIVGILEATLIAVPVQMLFDLTWEQRTAIVGTAALRATFAALSADGKSVEKLEEATAKHIATSTDRIDARVEAKLEEVGVISVPND